MKVTPFLIVSRKQHSEKWSTWLLEGVTTTQEKALSVAKVPCTGALIEKNRAHDFTESWR